MIDSVMVITAAFVLYFQNSTLFLVTIFLIPLHAIVAWSYTKPYQRIHRIEMEKGAEMNSYLVESLNGVSTIKAFNGERESEFEIEKRFISFIKTSFKVGIMKNTQSSIDSFLSNIGIKLLCNLAISKTVIILTHDNDFKNVASNIINLNELKRGK